VDVAFIFAGFVLLLEYCIRTCKHRRYLQSYLKRTTRIHSR